MKKLLQFALVVTIILLSCSDQVPNAKSGDTSKTKASGLTDSVKKYYTPSNKISGSYVFDTYSDAYGTERAISILEIHDNNLVLSSAGMRLNYGHLEEFLCGLEAYSGPSELLLEAWIRNDKSIITIAKFIGGGIYFSIISSGIVFQSTNSFFYDKTRQEFFYENFRELKKMINDKRNK